jgi:hypothetical protein
MPLRPCAKGEGAFLINLYIGFLKNEENPANQ